MKQKSIDLTFATWCNEKNTIAKRNARAAAYSNSIHNKKKRYAKEVILNIAMALCLLAIITVVFIKAFSTEPRYAIPYENGTYHYIYVTERICTVTEIVGDYITVYHNGNYYSFYGTGYIEGQTIICQFTDNWEIVGVTE